MTLGQIITTILVAILGATGGGFGFAQFLIKRRDDKEEKNIQKQIDETVEAKMREILNQCGEIGDQQIANAVEKARAEFKEGLEMRENTGRERFEINSEQIKENTEAIKNMIEMQKEMQIKSNERFNLLAESINSLTSVSRACAEGMRSTTYDRMLLVANKALKRGAITISEKTNLKQLYNSWEELQGNDAKVTTYFEDCMKLKSIPDEDED